MGKRQALQKNGVGKTANPQSENCITVSSYTIHKTKLDSKWIIDLKETPKTVKIWKKSGNSVMTLAWVCFFGNEPRVPDNKSKITQLIDITWK